MTKRWSSTKSGDGKTKRAASKRDRQEHLTKTKTEDRAEYGHDDPWNGDDFRDDYDDI